MSIINKPPADRETRIRIGRPGRGRRREVRRVHRQHAGSRRQFSPQDECCGETRTSWRWREATTGRHAGRRAEHHHAARGKSMIQRILNSKELRRLPLGGGYGNGALFRAAIPRRQCLSATHGSPGALVHDGLFYSYNLFLFTTPYIAYSIVLSGLYVFGLTVAQEDSGRQIASLSRPTKTRGSFPCCRRGPQQAQARAFRNPALARRSRSGHSSRAPPSSAQSARARRAAACTRSRSRFSPTARATKKRGLADWFWK